MISKTSHWSRLKHILAAEGVRIQSPLFHATKLEKAQQIATTGFMSGYSSGTKGSGPKDNAICFSRNLTHIKRGLYQSNEAVLILDERDLTKYHIYPYNWFSTPGRPEKRDSGDSEYETRVSLTPSDKDKPSTPYDYWCPMPETKIPAKHIKAVLLNTKVRRVDTNIYVKSVRETISSLFPRHIPVIMFSHRDVYLHIHNVAAMHEILYTTSNMNLKDMAASSPETPSEILDFLAGSDWATKWQVVNNPNTSIKTLKRLSMDVDDKIREAALSALEADNVLV